MATCKYCQKSGWRLIMSSDGLCIACERPVRQSINSHIRVLQSSLKTAGLTKSLNTMLSRFEAAMNSCRELIPYERKGIPTTETVPSSLLGMIENDRRVAARRWIENEIAVAHKKSAAAQTPAARIRPYTKILEHITVISAAVPGNSGLEGKEFDIRQRIDRTRLSSEIECAKKFAFKGQTKRACDAYLDALFIIRTNSIPDHELEANAAKIEAKIRELGGEVPTA